MVKKSNGQLRNERRMKKEAKETLLKDREDKIENKKRVDEAEEQEKIKKIDREAEKVISKLELQPVVILKSKNPGQVGEKDGKLYFPLFHMGCCGDPRGVVGSVDLTIPDKIDEKFFESIVNIITKYPFFDWDGESFQNNIIRPNLEHIRKIFSIKSEKILDRIKYHMYVCINYWNAKDEEEDGEIYKAPSVKHFFTAEDLSF